MKRTKYCGGNPEENSKINKRKVYNNGSIYNGEIINNKRNYDL